MARSIGGDVAIGESNKGTHINMMLPSGTSDWEAQETFPEG